MRLASTTWGGGERGDFEDEKGGIEGKETGGRGWGGGHAVGGVNSPGG